MATSQDVVNKILNFSDQEFFGLTEQKILAMEDQLLDMDFSGVAINCPKQVFTDQLDRLPMLVGIRCDGERDWDYPFPDNCVLVGMNLTEGSVWFNNALLTEKDVESRGGNSPVDEDLAKPPLEELEGDGAQICAIDVRTCLKLNWQSSTWAFAVLHFDWSSNVTQVYLKDADNAKPTISPRPVKPLPHPKAGSNLPNYQPHPLSPAMPANGSEFRLQVVEKEGELFAAIYGSFRFRFKDVYIPEPKLKHAFADGNTLLVSAIVPVTLAILAPNWLVPMHVTWNVPIYGPMLNPGEKGEGHFALNIGNFLQQLPQAHRYAVYILTDGGVYGPQELIMP